MAEPARFRRPRHVVFPHFVTTVSRRAIPALAAVFLLSRDRPRRGGRPAARRGKAHPSAAGHGRRHCTTGGQPRRCWSAQLQRDPRIEVRVVEDPHFLDSAALDRYQAIVLHFMNWKVPSPGEAARTNLKKAVAGGKGLVLVHFACGAWQDWPEFVNLAGRVWNPKFRADDRRGPFQVEIADQDHAITQGLQAFDTDDELYTCLDGKPPIEILATARSKVDGKDYPMAFVQSYGKGRVFHCVLGHDAKALGLRAAWASCIAAARPGRPDSRRWRR